MRLNVHAHILALDGVYVRDDKSGVLVFHALETPTHPETLSAAENDYDWKVLEWDLVAPANAKRILVWLFGSLPGEGRLRQRERDEASVVPRPIGL